MNLRTRVAVLLPVLALAPGATAQSVTLFGQSWQIQRFDYKAEVTWPNPVSPSNMLGLLRVEAAWHTSNGHVYVGTSHMDQSASATYPNFVIEIQALTNGVGSVTGFQYLRTIVENDPVLLSSTFDLRANGIAVNPSAAGIGANGGVIVCDAFNGLARWYDDATGALVPFGSGPNFGGMPIAPPTNDPQDMTIVIEPNPADSRLWVLDQPTLSLYSFDLDGVQDASFPVGVAANPAHAGDPKGLAWLPESPVWPSAFHGQGGVLFVTLGDAGPGFQVFRRDGTEIAYEPITNADFVTASPTTKPKIESVAADPATGRLFLFMEKGSLVDNWVWVLTPDCNANSVADALEIQGGAQSDWNANGQPDGCEGFAGTRFCFGDGSGTACPCVNSGPAGAGCTNSSGGAASLFATGLASVVADSIVFHAQGAPGTSTAVYFQGTAQDAGGAGLALFDGLRCVSGTAIRLGVHASSAGESAHPGPGDAPVSVSGMVPPAGATLHYQVLYRDPAAFCTSATANYTNGLTLVWTP